MTANIRGTLYAVMAAFFWSLLVLFSRWLNAIGIYALEIAQIRLTVGALALGVYIFCKHRDQFRIRLRDLWCFVGSGMVSVLLFTILYFKSLEYASIPTASVLISMSPIYVTINSRLLFKEKMTRSKLTALAMSIVGCVLVSGIASGFHGSALGVLLAVGAGFFYSFYPIFSRYAINRGYHSWTLVFYSFLLASVGCAFFSDWGHIARTFVSVGNAWLLYLGLGLLTGFFAYVSFSKALECMESSRATVASSSESAFCVILGIIFFGEWPDLLGFIGLVLILAALYVLNMDNKQ